MSLLTGGQWYATDYGGYPLPDDVSAAHDGDTTTYYSIFVPFNPTLPYAIVQDFSPDTVTINEIRLYLADGSGAQAEYWDGTQWVAIGNTTILNQWVSFSNLNIVTTKWRVIPYASGAPVGGYPYADVAEMEAYSGILTYSLSDTGSATDTTLTLDRGIEESGVGVDSASVSTLLTLTDTGAGSEQVTTSLLITLMDSGASEDVFGERGAEGREEGRGIETLMMGKEMYDTLTGADILPLLLREVTDVSALLNETATLIIPAADAGSFSEYYTAFLRLTLTDEGQGRENLITVIQASLLAFLKRME